MLNSKMVNVGFGNSVQIGRIIAVVNPGSSPIRKLKEEARNEKKIIDVTEGRRTRAIIILETGQLVLSSVQPETIGQRMAALIDEHDNGIRDMLRQITIDSDKNTSNE
ncbi:MAG: DUF370 domain-containing protein [Desulfobulbaceae bacterium]|nr:DUF370 domain-containing protein [Desulfobulbaceae bacterium]